MPQDLNSHLYDLAPGKLVSLYAISLKITEPTNDLSEDLLSFKFVFYSLVSQIFDKILNPPIASGSYYFLSIYVYTGMSHNNI